MRKMQKKNKEEAPLAFSMGGLLEQLIVYY